VSKLGKLKKDPVGFVKDSPIYQRVFGKDPNRKPEKAHPLPTLNLAKETQLSDDDLERIKAEQSFFRFRASPAARERVIGRIGDQIGAFMTEAGFPDRDYAADVKDFLDGYEGNPAAGARRTTAVGSRLWLFILARAVDPKVIVESGVYKGASLVTLRRAVPTAALYGFDIDLSNCMVKDPAITLHEGDWSQSFPESASGEDLCYFDDHINNCLRVREAYDLGFRHLIFDDSPDIGELHLWRYPGVPTIQMVVNKTLEIGEWVEWTWRKQKLHFVYREEDTHGAADLVETVMQLPSVTALTGRRTGIQTYVRLKRKDES
jgi:hypothetical protein